MPILGRSRSLRLRESQKDARCGNDVSQSAVTGAEAASRNELYILRPTASQDATASVPQRAGLRKSRSLRTVRRSDEPRTANPEKPSADSIPVSTSVYYTAEVYDDPTIGMALGSPSQAVAWNRPESSCDSRTASPAPSSTNTSDHGDKKPDQKLSRWRSIFGKKQAGTLPSKPFYQVQIQRVPTPLDYRTYPDQPRHVLVPKQGSPLVSEEDRKRPSPRRRGESEPTKSRTVKPSQSMKKQKSSSDRYNEEPNPAPPPKGNGSRIPAVTIDAPDATSIPVSTSIKPKSSGLMLDIDIPESQMERYSVMFGHLLRPDESSSLLSRRQNSNGHTSRPLDEFTVNTQSANRTHLKPLRRASSPSYNSPSFAVSLFPPPDTRASRAPSPIPQDTEIRRPLLRSQTEPVQSPARAFFSSLKPDRFNKTTTSPSSGSPQYPAINETPLSQEASAIDDAANSRHITCLTEEPSEELSQGIVKQDHVTTTHASPALISSPPTLSPPKGQTSKRSPLPPRKSSRPTSPPTAEALCRLPKTLEPSRMRNGTVQVGIARSVSLTRSRGPTGSRKDSMGLCADKDGLERFGERKAMVPTVVQLGEVPEHRKSQRVQIESA
ncbi:hypothetical protein EJ05DRAFT_255747 [Pseudovirgaria hyperparasitica]|uniref:Uncharacterized protein n=1 Tax=Pseudovirgaria hyperparasitica TaxID=470096 RepID=A0A6A6WGL0_9PEZI|nr:uncharacterized protein EJ05DRAFT_255747 [Pseudovirgaria hyperparasitica]KAF2761190.1 hypothetical protein EJ05DRAFT_255747 [Pseudovirgaria hyperparasitica]